jgi:hypothetical protein
MRKPTWAIVVALVTTCSLAACHNGTASDAASSSSNSQTSSNGTSDELTFTKHDDADQLAAAFDLLGTPRSATWYLKSEGNQLTAPTNLAWLEAVVVVTPETMKQLLTGPAAATSTGPDLTTAASGKVPQSAARLYEGRLTSESYYSGTAGRPGSWSGSMWLYPSANTVILKATFHPS